MPTELKPYPVEFESITVDERGDVAAWTRHGALVMTEMLPGGVPLDMVVILPTEDWIGSPPGEGFDDERPRHPVQLPIYAIGRTPVTQAQWQAITGSLPPVRDAGPDLPVHRINYHQARLFCDRLTLRTWHRYRLPSEAEWEVACRAGTTTPFHTGPTLTTALANYVGTHTYAREPEGVYRHCVTPAGLFPPNPFGLFDMHGNVWEWCADAWHPDYDGAPSDGRPWRKRLHARGNTRVVDADLRIRRGKYHVLRGGCWHDPPTLCRSAARLKSEANEPEDYFGLRVVLEMTTKKPSLIERLRRLVGIK